MSVRKILGWNLRRLRVKRGLTLEAVAGAVMDPSYVGRIERGRENPTIEYLEHLAKMLDANVQELFRPVRPGAKLPPGLKAGRKPGSRNVRTGRRTTTPKEVG